MAFDKLIFFIFIILINQSFAAKRIKDQDVKKTENENSSQISTGSCQNLKCGPGKYQNFII